MTPTKTEIVNWDNLPHNLSFRVGNDNEECLRFEPGGKVYIRGQLVDDNQEIYNAFAAWLGRVGKSGG